MRKEPPPQLNGVAAVPGSNEEGDVNAATEGSFVPPGVSGAPPKDCSNGLGSRLRDPPAWTAKKSGVLPGCWPGRGGGARGLACSALAASILTGGSVALVSAVVSKTRQDVSRCYSQLTQEA